MKRLIPLLFCSLLGANLSTPAYGDYGNNGDRFNPMNMMDRMMSNPSSGSDSRRRYGRYRYPAYRPGYGIPPYGPVTPYRAWPGAPVYPNPRQAASPAAPSASVAKPAVPEATTAGPSLPSAPTEKVTKEVATQRFRPLAQPTAAATTPDATAASIPTTVPGSFRPLETKSPESVAPSAVPQPAQATASTPPAPAMTKPVAGRPPQQLPKTMLPDVSNWTLPDGSKPVFRPLEAGE